MTEELWGVLLLALGGLLTGGVIAMRRTSRVVAFGLALAAVLAVAWGLLVLSG